MRGNADNGENYPYRTTGGRTRDRCSETYEIQDYGQEESKIANENVHDVQLLPIRDITMNRRAR